jgi:hypothetical protein
MPSIRSMSPLLLLFALVLVLAACGASSSSSSSTTSTQTTTTSSSTGSGASFANYATCLKQHGVTQAFGPGRGAAGGTPPTGTAGNRPQLSAADRKKFQAAQTACAKLRPAGARGGFPGGGPGGANSAAFAAYNNCLKLHGVTVTRGTRLSTATKKVKAAMTACASLRPAPAPTTSTSSAN